MTQSPALTWRESLWNALKAKRMLTTSKGSNSMKAGNARLWKPSAFFLALLLMTPSLVACSERGEQVDPAANKPGSAADDEATERYREKVKRRVSASVVKSLSREWGVPEAKVECLLDDLNVAQLEEASSDVAVAAVFDKCDVDPKVTE